MMTCMISYDSSKLQARFLDARVTTDFHPVSPTEVRSSPRKEDAYDDGWQKHPRPSPHTKQQATTSRYANINALKLTPNRLRNGTVALPGIGSPTSAFSVNTRPISM
jgi:hypothetical protein